MMQQNSNKINEGLVRHSLQYLVLPNISIDEYESKISDKRAIVVAMYVNDEEPAEDLSNFINRSRYAILDTEVSPAPTPDGHFVVFTEIQRDDAFPKTLTDILEEISNLCDIEDWTFTGPNNTTPTEANTKEIAKYITLNQADILDIPDEDEDTSNDTEDAEVDGEDEETDDTTDDNVDVEDSVEDDHISSNTDDDVGDDEVELPPLSEDQEFWQNADAQSVMINENILIINKLGSEYSYQLIETVDSIGAIQLNDSAASRLQRVLGPGYNVFATVDGLLVEALTYVPTFKMVKEII